MTAIDPATGQQVPLATVSGPDGAFPEEFGTAVGGGDVVVLMSNPPTQGSGTSPTGATAVAIRPGSRQERVLGPAIRAFAGMKPGTVWLWAGDAYKSGTLAQSYCSVREVTVSDTMLERPVSLSCDWTVVGATSKGLLVEDLGSQGGSDPIEAWDPTTGQFTPETGGLGATGGPNAAGVVAVAGNGVLPLGTPYRC
jgi:hypothetical protein